MGEEFAGNIHCKASGSNTKRLVLKVGQWEQLGSWKNPGFYIVYIYVRLGTPEQCASAKNSNEFKLKEGKSCVLLDKRWTRWEWAYFTTTPDHGETRASSSFPM